MKNKSLKLVLIVFSAIFIITGCSKDDNNNPAPVDKSTIFSVNTLVDSNGDVVETIVTITDRGEGIGTRTLNRNKTWVLDGLVFVNSGQTLSIEEGTVIKGKSGQGEKLQKIQLILILSFCFS